MDLAQSDTEQIKALIRQHAGKGYTLIAFLSEQPILYIDDLTFFNNSYNALEFCYENSTDLDRYTCGTFESVSQLIENQEQQNRIYNLKNREMNQENFEYLKKQVKNAGFGEGLENELKEKMESLEPRFQLKHDQPFGDDQTESTLNFRKSDKNDNYFFNSYVIAIKADPENAQKTSPKQTFFLGKGNNFTLHEAYNLLRNRFVNKTLVTPTGDEYNGWAKLNTKETDANGNYKLKYYNEKWNYNVEEALGRYPIIKEAAAELNNGADRASLIESLKKGDNVPITLVQDGIEKKGYVQANVYNYSVYVTDEQHQKVYMKKAEGNAKSEKQGQSEKNSESKNQRQQDQDKNAENKDQKNIRRHGHGVS